MHCFLPKLGILFSVCARKGINAKIELNKDSFYYYKMNRRINKAVELYFERFKNDIAEKATQGADVARLLKIIQNYPAPLITPKDYEKRQRTKNVVPLYERCKAKRANGEQCTRRKRKGEDLCGTHIKGAPHGIIDTPTEESMVQKIDVWIQEINGINYYIDANENIYDPQDVYQNKPNPRRIHKYHKDAEGRYIIMDL